MSRKNDRKNDTPEQTTQQKKRERISVLTGLGPLTLVHRLVEERVGGRRLARCPSRTGE
jgi:hypothetical protein